MWNDQFGTRSLLSSWVAMRWAECMNYESLSRLEHQIADLDATLARLKGQIHQVSPPMPALVSVARPHTTARSMLGLRPGLQGQTA